MSKGGVFYHFASKDALIEGMLSDLIARFEAEHQKQKERDSAMPGAWTRAYIRATFPSEPSANPDASSALIAAVAGDPTLLSVFQDKMVEWQAQIEQDGLDKIDATLVRLAVDGLWYAELFGAAPLSKTDRQRVIERLLEAAQAGGTVEQ